MSDNPDDSPPSEEEKPKKGPKLFRPGALPKESDKSGETNPAKPRLFKPSSTPPPNPTPISSPAPAAPARPKLFKAGEAKPAPTAKPVAAPPMAPAKSAPTLKLVAAPPMAPTKPAPTLKPVAAPPMAPAKPAPVPSPSPAAAARPKLFKAGESKPASVPTPAAPPMAPAKPAPVTKAVKPTPAPPQAPIVQSVPPIEKEEQITEQPKVEEKKGKAKEKGKEKSVSPKDEKRKISTDELLALTAKPSKKETKKSKENIPKATKGIRELLFEETDVRAMWYKSIIAGLVGCLSMVFIAYLIYCFSSKSILSLTTVFSVYSNGNVFNEFVGLWTATFTPISGLNSFVPGWLNDWYLYLAPVVVAALIIGVSVKNLKYSFLGVIFFIFFSILIPLIFLFILPMFNLLDPSSIDGGLIAAYPSVVSGLWSLPQWVMNISHSVFLGWNVAGGIELGLFALPFTLVFSIIFSIFARFRSKD